MEAQLGNLETATSLFRESLKRCPNHAQTYQAWAVLELRQGNLFNHNNTTLVIFI